MSASYRKAKRLIADLEQANERLRRDVLLLALDVHRAECGLAVTGAGAIKSRQVLGLKVPPRTQRKLRLA